MAFLQYYRYYIVEITTSYGSHKYMEPLDYQRFLLLFHFVCSHGSHRVFVLSGGLEMFYTSYRQDVQQKNIGDKIK